MRRRLVLISLGVGLAAVAFVVGRWCGSVSTSEKLMQEEMSRWDQFALMDKTVLQTFPARSNTMTSGTYLMQVWFSKMNLGTQEVVFHCENGQISVPAPNTFSRSRGTQTLSVTGNVVSWTQEGSLYEANAKYVGLIDGDGMWGRVYGWNPGDQSVGFWRIYPKPAQAPPTKGSSQ
jgi:hypothetical protein